MLRRGYVGGMNQEWVLLEVDLAGDPAVEIWATVGGLLAVEESDWPE